MSIDVHPHSDYGTFSASLLLFATRLCDEKLRIHRPVLNTPVEKMLIFSDFRLSNSPINPLRGSHSSND